MNWEAYQYNKPEGRTRRLLAERVQLLFPEYDIQGRDFIRQAPVYSSCMWDLCAWTATFRHLTDQNKTLGLHSWSTMTELIRHGFTVEMLNPFEGELHPIHVKKLNAVTPLL